MTHAAQFALAHGAALLFIWILLQQAGVPIPSAPLLIAVGSLASYGRLRIDPHVTRVLTFPQPANEGSGFLEWLHE